MPLTKEEREFLDAFVYEATHEPFGGSATNQLRHCGISYADLHWLLTAFDRESRAEGILPFGKKNLTPPPCPWINLDDVNLRNAELRKECEKTSRSRSGRETVDPQPALINVEKTAPMK